MAAAILLTDIYHLEQQLKQVDEERDRLSIAGYEGMLECQIM